MRRNGAGSGRNGLRSWRCAQKRDGKRPDRPPFVALCGETERKAAETASVRGVVRRNGTEAAETASVRGGGRRNETGRGLIGLRSWRYAEKRNGKRPKRPAFVALCAETERRRPKRPPFVALGAETERKRPKRPPFVALCEGTKRK